LDVFKAMQATIDILGVTRYILLWVILESSHGTQRSMSHRAGDLMIEVCLKLVLLFDFLGPVVLSGDGQGDEEVTDGKS
jgi:hypothetical protein